jgi:hypothetical protein
MSLLERDETVPEASDDYSSPPAAPSPEGLLRPRTLLRLARRCWPQLRTQQGLGPHPTVLALMYALSRLEVLEPEERWQLGLLRAQLPKALLALDAPAAEAMEVWRQLPVARDPAALAAALRRAAATRRNEVLLAAGLLRAAALVEDLDPSPGPVPDPASEAPGEADGRRALARALARGALLGAITRGVSAEAVGCAGALRELIEQLSAAAEVDDA